MPSHQIDEQRLGALQEQLDRARTLTPELMGDVITRACLRLQAQHPAAKANIIRLIECGAFVDSVLTLLELELPHWRLRRLIYEDGEWHCNLSNQLGLPVELDSMAEGHRESLPMALLSAFLEARHASLAEIPRRPPSVPQVLSARGEVVCCDNFR